MAPPMNPLDVRQFQLRRDVPLSCTVSQDYSDEQKVHVQRLCALGGGFTSQRQHGKRSAAGEDDVELAAKRSRKDLPPINLDKSAEDGQGNPYVPTLGL